MFGVFRVRNHDFTPKNHIFPILGGGGARRVRPPLDPPLYIVVLLMEDTGVRKPPTSRKLLTTLYHIMLFPVQVPTVGNRTHNLGKDRY
jgi:hypothetical protein